MWNTPYLSAKKLPALAGWSDLFKPAYFSHVAISAPSRSGTTHLTVEAILQGEAGTVGADLNLASSSLRLVVMRTSSDDENVIAR